MKNKKIFITGSSGQSGREIAKLLAKEYEIVGFDKIQGASTTIVADLTDWETIKNATKGVSAIIHTASLHAPHVATHSREDFINTNIKGTLYLLEASKINGVKKFVYTSTTSLYGESMNIEKEAAWITEEVVPKPRDIYDITKITAEELCKDFFDKETFQAISLRVSRFWEEPPENKVFYRMYRGLDIRDVARAHELALKAEMDNFEVFNVSAQSIFNQDDLFDLKNNLHALLNSRIPKLVDFFDKNGWELPTSIDRVYVIEKAKKVLNYQPVFNIDEMLSEF
ncbi:MAG: NAD(P)-dependent oxidoreductase [Saprospiraceae bacterium]|nr:NAD(P)-dependent oxidoreductase [Saprospiraceae bacterium]